MSLSKNRIIKHSVSFTEEPFQLHYPKNIEEESLPEEETNEFYELFESKEQFVKERNFIAQERARLAQEAERLLMKEQHLQQEYETLQQMKAQFQQHTELEQQELGRRAQDMQIELCDLLWDHSLQLAEKMVNQAIDTRQLSMTAMLKGVIETLPMAFEKLQIAVHPETYEVIQAEKSETKEYWLLELVEWKFDFSLGVGDFIIEEEKQYFEFRLKAVFEQLKEKLHNRKRFEVEGE